VPTVQKEQVKERGGMRDRDSQRAAGTAAGSGNSSAYVTTTYNVRGTMSQRTGTAGHQTYTWQHGASSTHTRYVRQGSHSAARCVQCVARGCLQIKRATFAHTASRPQRARRRHVNHAIEHNVPHARPRPPCPQTIIRARHIQVQAQEARALYAFEMTLRYTNSRRIHHETYTII
jgi:hypothetical protein